MIIVYRIIRVILIKRRDGKGLIINFRLSNSKYNLYIQIKLPMKLLYIYCNVVVLTKRAYFIFICFGNGCGADISCINLLVGLVGQYAD